MIRASRTYLVFSCRVGRFAGSVLSRLTVSRGLCVSVCGDTIPNWVGAVYSILTSVAYLCPIGSGVCRQNQTSESIGFVQCTERQ